MACDDLITNQDLENAKKDATTMSDFVESDSPNITSKNGKNIRTLQGINDDADNLISSLGGVDIGDYENDETLNSYNEYVVFDRAGATTGPSLWKAIPPRTPTPGTPLPYTIDSTTYPDPTSDPNIEPFSDINKAGAEQIAQEESNAGDSQLAGGAIFPLSSQDSLPLGAQSSAVPAGIDRLRVSTGDGADGVEVLYLWEDSGDFSSSSQTVTDISQNTLGGYDVVTNIQTYEFTTSKNRDLRFDIDIRGWGADITASADATPSFNSALSFADEWDDISLNDGSYLIGAADVNKNNITIKGTGVVVKSSSEEYAIGISGIGCKVLNLGFKGQQTSGQPNSDIRFLEGCKDVTVSFCTFEGAGYSAIVAADDTGSGGSIYTNPVEGILITNNIFKAQTPDSIWYTRPLYFTSIKNMTVSNNIFRDTAFDAIRIREDDGYVNISNNQFINIGDKSWPDEQTRDCIDTAFQANQMVISGNVVDTCAYRGFDIKAPGTFDPASTNKKIIIQGNVLKNLRYEGIAITSQDTTSTFLSNISIDNNVIDGANQNNAGVGNSGIFLNANHRNLSITNNHVIACLGRGIYAIGPSLSSEVTRYTRISGNHVVNCSNAGIRVNDIGPVTISENYCVNDSNEANFDAQEFGIVVEQSVISSILNAGFLINNTCVGNTTLQISMGGTGFAASIFHQISGNVEIGTGAYTSRTRIKDSRRTLRGNNQPQASDGNFEVGDLVFNSQPVVGQPLGWICTVAGNPGTWVALANV